MKLNNFITLAIFLSLCFGASYIGARATFPEINTWYATLHKPSFNPPHWIFGPVWTTLYIMMALAACWVCRKVGFFHPGQILFYLQLIANTLWSIFFFGMHRIDIAFVDIVILWGLIGFMINAYRKTDAIAALLLVP